MQTTIVVRKRRGWSKMAVITAGIFFLTLACRVYGSGEVPDQGFFMVTNLPSAGRTNGIPYVYAIDTNIASRVGEIEISISKDGLDTSAVKEGEIWADGVRWGCYIAISPPKMAIPTRFGNYTGVLAVEATPIRFAYTFIRPDSKFLDTDGVYTLTVYPTAVESITLQGKNSIGVRRMGCTRYTWFKDGKKLKATSARLPITCTQDGGLYTVSRAGSSRRSRGWFVQILVIVAGCPKGEIYAIGTPPTCTAARITCLNGGILRDERNDCICNPYYGLNTCRCVVRVRDGKTFTLGDTRAETLLCKDLPGGSPKCRGMLFCYGGLYGCKCAPGWHGNRCDRPCSKGRWGSNCELACPEDELDCSRFFGPVANLQCN